MNLVFLALRFIHALSETPGPLSLQLSTMIILNFHLRVWTHIGADAGRPQGFSAIPGVCAETSQQLTQPASIVTMEGTFHAPFTNNQNLSQDQCQTGSLNSINLGL
jgi:hypothetical protein